MEQTLVRHFVHNNLILFDFGDYNYACRHGKDAELKDYQFGVIRKMFDTLEPVYDKVTDDDLFGYTFMPIHHTCRTYYKWAEKEWLEAFSHAINWFEYNDGEAEEDALIYNVLTSIPLREKAESMLGITLPPRDNNASLEALTSRTYVEAFEWEPNPEEYQFIDMLEPCMDELAWIDELNENALPHDGSLQQGIADSLCKFAEARYRSDSYQITLKDNWLDVQVRNPYYFALMIDSTD